MPGQCITNQPYATIRFMNDREQRRSVEDDSLLASVAGVPLTRSARIGACLIWAAFWCARFLLTDALLYISAGQLRPALLQLLGENAFDQAFSIGMVWLTVEVAIIIWNTLKTVAIMLIAKKGKPLLHVFVDNLSDENGSVSFQVVWLSRPCSCSSASRLCSVHTVPSFSRRRNSRLCLSNRDVVRCAACPVAK